MNALKYGVADTLADGYITGNELGAYLQQQVTSAHVGQTPQVGRLTDPRFSLGEFLFESPSTASMANKELPDGVNFDEKYSLKKPANQVIEAEKKTNWLWILGGALLVGAAVGAGGGDSGGGSPVQSDDGSDTSRLIVTLPKH